ncbi:MAG: hypothetical protein GX270_06015 [Clostridiaceae bacterium]|nr:hypothetical protein [Clostridiaceae bacterium]
MKKRVISSVFALIMLLSFTACENKQSEPNPTMPIVTVDPNSMNNPLKDSNDKIFGRWEAESGLAIEISTDGHYAYFLDKSNESDNYYKGPAEIHSSANALAETKISLQDYLGKYDTYTGGYYNLFSLKLHYETFQSEGEDKSDTLNKAEYMDFLFLLSKDSDDNARLINMADSTSTELIRVK